MRGERMLGWRRLGFRCIDDLLRRRCRFDEMDGVRSCLVCGCGSPWSPNVFISAQPLLFYHVQLFTPSSMSPSVLVSKARKVSLQMLEIPNKIVLLSH